MRGFDYCGYYKCFGASSHSSEQVPGQGGGEAPAEPPQPRLAPHLLRHLPEAAVRVNLQ